MTQEMSSNETKERKEVYWPPKILASYDKKTLEETLNPHGQDPQGGGCGCGCGCGVW
jgi:hypothetical protein